ncbi:MAG: hypothetical protein ACOYJ1_17020 [Peptococcales bacterium]|jgi:hypothetical protein
MYELGIDMIFARTAQAKGRIERMWDTLQGRLPVEFARRGIKTVEQANIFLIEEYQSIFNRKFSVEPEKESIYVPLAPDVDIDCILCIKHERMTDNAGTFSFKNRCFQILDEGFPIISTRKKITVLISPRIGIKIEYKKRVYDTIRYLKPQKKNASQKVQKKISHNVSPHLIYGTDKWKNIWWSEDYDLSLKFLYELFFEKQQSAS